MNLQLSDNKIISLSFGRTGVTEQAFEKAFKLDTGNSFIPEKPNLFAVFFKLEINNPEFQMTVESAHWFVTSDDITEEFKLSEFVHVNAPAIAFPFLRAFVGNFTLQSGYNPVLLPSINFIELANNEDVG